MIDEVSARLKKATEYARDSYPDDLARVKQVVELELRYLERKGLITEVKEAVE